MARPKRDPSENALENVRARISKNEKTMFQFKSLPYGGMSVVMIKLIRGFLDGNFKIQ